MTSSVFYQPNNSREMGFLTEMTFPKRGNGSTKCLYRMGRDAGEETERGGELTREELLELIAEVQRHQSELDDVEII